jgi:predicted secreted protein
MSKVTLTQADNGRIVEVTQRQTIVICLSEAPATGFRWSLDDVDEDTVVLQSSVYAEAPDSAIGGGGHRVLTFEARRVGTARLQLKLRREWRPPDEAIERFEVTIRVRA